MSERRDELPYGAQMTRSRPKTDGCLDYFKSRRDEPLLRGQSGTPLHGTSAGSRSAYHT